MDEIASLTPSFAGISHERLDSEEVHGQGLQWPCTSKDHPGTPIMHVGKFSAVLAGSILQNMYRQQSFRMRNIQSSL